MRRRHQRSPQNHALVASVAGVILLCGVVSVQTTQASQAFSHEQGMARMAAPQGSDAGATTAGDATWWSFCARCGRCTPTTRRRRRSWARATAATRRSTGRSPRKRRRSSGSGPGRLPQGRAGAHPRGAKFACGGSARGARGTARRPRGARPSRRRAAPAPARGARGPAGGGAPRGRPGRAAAAPRPRRRRRGPAAAERELRGVAKRRHARLRNAAAGCFLVVRAKDGNKGDAEGDESTWLRCDSVQADGVEAVFEVTQGNTPDTIRFKSMANALFVEMVPPTRRLGWVLRAVVADPSSRNVPTADFRREGNAFKAIASGGAITVIVDGAPRDSNPVRGHGNKPHNKQGGSAGDRYAQFVVEYLDDDALSRAKTTQERVEREQTELMTKPADVKCEGKCVVSYGLYGSDPEIHAGRGPELGTYPQSLPGLDGAVLSSRGRARGYFESIEK